MKDAFEDRISQAGYNPEDGSSLTIELTPDEATQYLYYHPQDRPERGEAIRASVRDVKWPLLLAEYDFPTQTLTTFPTWLRAYQSNFTRPKYSTIKRISFEDMRPMHHQEDFGLFFELPTGFLRKPFEGFGVDPRLRYIIDAFDVVDGAEGLTICYDDEISLVGGEIRLPEHLYHEVRMDINRAHEATLRFANGEKIGYLRNRLLPLIVPDFKATEYERPLSDLQDTVQSALSKKGIPRSSNTNSAAAVRMVIREVDQLAKEEPVRLFELSEKIEIASLQVLIDDMQTELLRNRKEAFWQSYFSENPFVLKMLFGLPMILYASQASVGGMGHHRSGEKYSDFLVEAGLLGNLGMVEIKTPGTALLSREPYRRPSLYGPSFELTGGVNQLLDQKLKLIKNIAAKKEEDDQHHIQAWSVPCILIIGSVPNGRDERRSFEMYRGGQRDVLIITFDELLAKLKALHGFLTTKPSDQDHEMVADIADVV